MNVTLGTAIGGVLPFFKYGMIFFFYYFITGGTAPFLAVWLGDVGTLDAGAIGLMFGSQAVFAMLFQPLFGVLSDRLDHRKHLLCVVIGLLILLAPFMNWVFAPLLRTHLMLAALVGGVYLGITFAAGGGALEVYIEKACRANRIPYGRVRMFGAIGFGFSAAISGMLISTSPESIFWLGSLCAVLMAVLVYRIKPCLGVVPTGDGAEKTPPVSYAAIGSLLLDRRFWFLVLYVVGVACLYDIFDQQFVNYFRGFFESPQQGMQVFGFVTTLTECMVALGMFLIPGVLNRIGGKNALIIAGLVMWLRITGSGLATTPYEMVALKMLHALEVPLVFIGMFKYIEDVFGTRLSATIYMVGFVFAKGVGATFISPLAGHMYEVFGFRHTYIVLGSSALLFTIISMFSLDSGKHRKPVRLDLRKSRSAVVKPQVMRQPVVAK
ncbi:MULTISPECIES: oligosaccharide MFS transporter [unclassified Pseudomonas]|uniref:oligosaccharide MFS transporter n=1 Tax=unclassified Pseudomonas TaxID=196821 RepID=UPI002DB6FE5B|nr:oligosaccharide MFS transporter [Pseudomonas sp. DSV-1]MEC4239407.1 oligosaccharide MFS transporter [Pseudomonas sp. DSV-1]